jgi:DNA-binding phage protein
MLGMVVPMEPKPWRDRVRDEEELLAQLNQAASDAASRRAQALRDGVDELGTVAEVARALGRSWQAVDQALKRDQRRQASKPDATTTE